jgi:FkbM family methyltransferase
MGFLTDAGQTIYLSRGRVLLRRLGMRQALGLISALRLLPDTFRDAPLPAWVTVPLNGVTSRFLVSSTDELRRTQTLGGEGRFLQRLLQQIRPGEVIYDIGANLGLYTIFLAKSVGPRGRIIGFEPELRSFERCQENLRLNSLANVRVFDRALGNEDREIVLAVDESAASGVHHVLGRRDGETSTGWQAAKMVVGDRFIDMESLPTPNVIKIDVEGMEEEVLLGLTQTLHRPQCRLVFCEIHFAVLDQRGRWDAPRRILRFLEDCGFDTIEWLNYGHVMATKGSQPEQQQPC